MKIIKTYLFNKFLFLRVLELDIFNKLNNMKPICIKEIRDEVYKQINRKYKSVLSKLEKDYNLMCLKYHFTSIEKYNLIRENQQLLEKLTNNNMKRLLLLRSNQEPLKIILEEVDDIIALDYPTGIIKVRTISGLEYLGYMIKFE